MSYGYASLHEENATVAWLDLEAQFIYRPECAAIDRMELRTEFVKEHDKDV
jgi:hypothetical protein